ncbi:MAG TPA: aromatic/alkene monooxygenase hydroxylase subunit beta [Solirubrobacteraceae bacterium]|nr:aromatic/alkene monooxygenase hydroxylase subunit beta [Solirubrobacteraceae bacterium]
MADTLSPEQTPEQTPTGRVRSVPKLVFTDAEAGALEFPSSNSRRFNYFEPARMKATLYEDVTVDVQPDPERYLTQNWVYGFAKGPGGYPKEWTAAKSSDWHWFRDPNQEWEQTIYRNNAREVRQVEASIANARNEGAFERWSKAWSQAVEKHVGAWMHPEHGLGMHVFVPAQRDAPTNMINNAISVNSMHKLRIAQDLALFNLESSEARNGFDGQAHLEAWNNDPVWQPARETVENLTAIRDWCEAVTAANLAFEPLVGELFRSGYVMSTAAANGDFVTPAVMGVAESDFERDLGYTIELVNGLTHDEKYAEENRKLFSRWLAEPIAQSLRAAKALEPIWSETESAPVSFKDVLSRCRERVRGILKDLEIPTPKELDQ